MLQRPQTAYAIVAILTAAVLPFTAVSDHLAADPQGWWPYMLWASLLMAASAAVPGILRFRDRPAQADWFRRAFLFSLPASGMVWGVVLSMLVSGAPVEGEWVSAVLASGLSLGLWAARRGVLADEAKVRSMDRIR